jgi:hypothetical protein
VLALRLGTTGNPDSGNDFITFVDGDWHALGSIEGNGAGGVQLGGSGSDYAEYLPRLDPEEELGPGDVVGLHGDGVALATQGAGRLMVVSSGAIVGLPDPAPMAELLARSEAKIRTLQSRLVEAESELEVVLTRLDTLERTQETTIRTAGVTVGMEPVIGSEARAPEIDTHSN